MDYEREIKTINAASKYLNGLIKKDKYEMQKKICNPKPKPGYGCDWNVCIMSSTKECHINICKRI